MASFGDKKRTHLLFLVTVVVFVGGGAATLLMLPEWWQKPDWGWFWPCLILWWLSLACGVLAEYSFSAPKPTRGSLSLRPLASLVLLGFATIAVLLGRSWWKGASERSEEALKSQYLAFSAAAWMYALLALICAWISARRDRTVMAKAVLMLTVMGMLATTMGLLIVGRITEILISPR